VDDDSCNLIVAQLLWLDANDPEKVEMFSRTFFVRLKLFS